MKRNNKLNGKKKKWWRKFKKEKKKKRKTAMVKLETHDKKYDEVHEKQIRKKMKEEKM